MIIKIYINLWGGLIKMLSMRKLITILVGVLWVNFCWPLDYYNYGDDYSGTNYVVNNDIEYLLAGVDQRTYSEILGVTSEFSITDLDLNYNPNGFILEYIDGYSFLGRESLRSVKYALGVRYSGKKAFANCPNLVSVDMSAIYESYRGEENEYTPRVYFGVGLFSGCTSLMELKLPRKFYVVGKSMFEGCTSLPSVTLPSSVESIGERAFYGCSSLETINLPASVTEIGPMAFAGCDKLTISLDSDNKNVVIKDGILYLDGGSTLNYILTPIEGEFTVPSSVTKINDGAFACCNRLTTVKIPKTVTEISPLAFAYNLSIENVIIDSDNSKYKSVDGVVYTKADNKMCAFPGGREILTIPATMTEIPNGMFKSCFGLKKIVFSDGVVNVGEYAFADCTNLESIIFSNTLKKVGKYAFCGCKSLTTLCFPSSLEIIPEGAFEDCSSLVSVDIPASVKTIYSSAFSNCIALEEISVDSANKYYCSNDGVLYSKDGESLYLRKCPVGRQTCVLPDNVYAIVEGAFANCDKLSTIVLPSKVRTIYGEAFSGCTALKTITLPLSLKEIKEYAFYNCSALKSVTLPNSLNFLGDCSFALCASLDSIAIPEKIANIGTAAFYGCKNLGSISFPTGLNKINDLAFYGCDSLITVSFPEKISIGQNTFYNCMSLETINFPSEINYLGEYAFYNCDNVAEINYPTTSPERFGYLYCPFSFNIYDSATLYLAEGYDDDLPEPWSKFKHVEGKNFAGVEAIDGIFDNDRPIEIYNLQGVRMTEKQDKLPPSIYVVRQGAKTKKVFLK